MNTHSNLQYARSTFETMRGMESTDYETTMRFKQAVNATNRMQQE